MRKLELRQFDSLTALTVAEYCQQQGWQDDLRYAESYVRLRSQKGYGPRRIATELKERGIEQTTISMVLAEADVEWHQVAESLLAKRMKLCGEASPKEKAKQQRFLLYRGFDMAEVQSLLQHYF